MNLKVTLSEKRKVVIESLEFSSDDGSVVLGLWWVDTHFTPGKVEGKDVTIYTTKDVSASDYTKSKDCF